MFRKTLSLFSLLDYLRDHTQGRIMKVCWAQTLTRKPFPELGMDDNFQNECLSSSNDVRNKHHSPNFTIDQSAIDHAKFRCQTISQYPGLSYGHKGVDGKVYGENLYWFGSGKNIVIPCSGAIGSWASEERYYNYSIPGFNGKAGHFTQLVWKSSASVGCARCGGKGDKYETYIVCNYKPPGNYPSASQFQTNVLPP